MEGVGKHRAAVAQAKLADVRSATAYRDALGLAAKYDSLAKLNPTLKDRLAPFKSVIDNLRNTESILVTIDGIRKTVSLDEYEELHEGNPEKYPWTGMAATLQGVLTAQTREMETVLGSVPVQTRGAPGGGAPGALPPEIAGMTPEQIPQNILDIENEIINLSSELKTLGAPGSRMPGTVKAAPLSAWPAYGAPPATTAAPEPQTLGYVNRRESEITQKIENLKAKKRQLEGFVRTPAP